MKNLIRKKSDFFTTPNLYAIVVHQGKQVCSCTLPLKFKPSLITDLCAQSFSESSSSREFVDLVFGHHLGCYEQTTSHYRNGECSSFFFSCVGFNWSLVSRSIMTKRVRDQHHLLCVLDVCVCVCVGTSWPLSYRETLQDREEAREDNNKPKVNLQRKLANPRQKEQSAIAFICVPISMWGIDQQPCRTLMSRIHHRRRLYDASLKTRLVMIVCANWR